MAKRILIADDAAFMRMMLKDILTKGGYEIAGEAADGNEALSKYKELKPDLVTMDITMPNCDGIQSLLLLQKILLLLYQYLLFLQQMQEHLCFLHLILLLLS